ncbi:ureidoglycolate lyase [Cereibacter changlensis]|uniref:Ureidoglycolate lyase n=1 Tax=Cereibacter changlensis TaxID=402884 RepID=A0A4U0Z2J1_9RHOB|nr:ureidoglycolate lyase [Cereibacter changlensis]TKA96714.1 ureidoglycolate lyase [Cereibacter changlensis]
MTRPLHLESLTAEAFRPFGKVIEADASRRRLINNGTTERFDALASVDAGEGGTAILSIFRARAIGTPLVVTMLERHPLGAQAFVPMQRQPWLVVVAEEPVPSALRVFLARGDQGVQYAAGTWHHPILPLHAPQEFLVVDRDRDQPNREVATLASAVFINLSALETAG